MLCQFIGTMFFFGQNLKKRYIRRDVFLNQILKAYFFLVNIFNSLNTGHCNK